MLKKMEQMKKKAESVVNTVDISEREKAAQLRRWVFSWVEESPGELQERGNASRQAVAC